MEHQHAAHLTYDHQGHEMSMTEMHHSGQHSEHMINYDRHQAESMGMSMMKMYFHFGFGDTVLFQNLVIDSAWKLWLISVALFLAAILLELIDYSRGYLSCRCVVAAANTRHASASSQAQLINSGSSTAVRQEPDGSNQRWSCCSGSKVQVAGGIVNGCDRSDTERAFAYFPVQTTDSPMVRLVQSLLHFIRTALSLSLMLVAMTYNLCLIFPIILGSGVGFYIFYRPALDSKSVMCH